MGTSKGYIAPSTPQWAKAKRGVSYYVGSPSDSSIKQAVTDYAKALSLESNITESVADIFSQIFGFVLSSNSEHGFSGALREINREDLLNLNSADALTELTYHFAHNGNTIDDAIALDCISNTFDILEIKDITDMEHINVKDIVKELVCQFAKLKFAQMFDKQIRNKCNNTSVSNARIAEVQDYIYETLKFKFDNNPSLISAVNPKKLSEFSIVKEIITNSLRLLEV